ncbi:MAG: DNA mismatch repair endonuclease MutL [Alphaproteobacteria bacterium]|nr:DNA mismatch repair endonuclease MutL [Alphaproteobacteria bacterium]
MAAIRILPEYLINQIAAGEVVERPASVVKELVENALDAGADMIVIDVTDGGRGLISIIDNGCGMSRIDLEKSIMRHATSKLQTDDLLNINTMGFRGEALPSIASVSDMTIDTCRMGESGLVLDCSTGRIKPSAWESGTRIRVENLFAKTPARLKFLRADRAEMMSVVEVVKRLALSRPDVGFILNNKWRFPKNQPLMERVIAVMGEDTQGRMIELDTVDSGATLRLSGFISEPTLRRASSIDQYLFVNGRIVKDKVLNTALRASYMDVMSAREFPLCALYLELPAREVDVNVHPAKTEVHFLEPARVRSFIIRTIRDALSRTMIPGMSAENFSSEKIQNNSPLFIREPENFIRGLELWGSDSKSDINYVGANENSPTGVRNDERANYHTTKSTISSGPGFHSPLQDFPLGRAIGQIGNKYIIAENASGMVIVDQHAAHERITYERLRARELKRQPLLVPAIIKLKPEEVSAIIEIREELDACGLKIDEFGDDSVAIYERPADWEMDWAAMLRAVAQEVGAHSHSSKLVEKLHLKLANYACHHSVRAGQKLDYAQMDALLRDIENTERSGQCNHGRPVYKIIKISELDSWFERV